ncbi:hypothetical protein ACFX2I_016801 [Malus domestica]
MESVASNSSPQNHRLAQRPRTRIIPTQPFADRILRALHHNLRLLHHRESNFSVLGATGNVYTVSLSPPLHARALTVQPHASTSSSCSFECWASPSMTRV